MCFPVSAVLTPKCSFTYNNNDDDDADAEFNTSVARFVWLNQHVLFCSKLLQYIQQKICSHEVQVVAMAKQLHNSIAQEVDKFAALPLNQLHYSGLDRSVI